MTGRREQAIPRGLERALHGGRAIRATSDPMHPPEPWELVTTAIELAFLVEARDAPPTQLRATITRLLDLARTTTR